MRIPNEVHLAQDWRIHDLVEDFTLEDVWTLPEITGSASAFADVVRMAAQFDPASSESLPTRFLWGLRDRLGQWLDLGRISAPAAGASAARAGGCPSIVPPYSNMTPRRSPARGRSHARLDHRGLWLIKAGWAQAEAAAGAGIPPAIKRSASSSYERLREA